MSVVDMNATQYLCLQRVDLNASDCDALLTRLDINGHLLSPGTRLGSDKKEYPRYLQKTFSAANQHDGYIIVGATDYGSEASAGTDLFLIRTNLLGEVKWSRRYGKKSSSEYGLCVVQMPDLGFVAVGYSKESRTDSSLYVLRTDSEGKSLWNRVYYYPKMSSVANYVELLPGAEKGGLYVTGTIQYKAGNTDVLLLNLNPKTGTIVWSNRYWHNSAWNETGKGVRLAKSNQRIAVTGTTNAYEFTFMTDLNGVPAWGCRYAYESEIFDPAGIVLADAEGNNLLVGGTIRRGNARRAFFHKIVAANGTHVLCNIYQWDTTNIVLNDVRQTFRGGFTGIGTYQGLNDTYILHTDALLATPADCKPVSLKLDKTDGIKSTAVTPTYKDVETFDFPVRTVRFEEREHRCFGQ